MKTKTVFYTLAFAVLTLSSARSQQAGPNTFASPNFAPAGYAAGYVDPSGQAIPYSEGYPQSYLAQAGYEQCDDPGFAGGDPCSGACGGQCDGGCGGGGMFSNLLGQCGIGGANGCGFGYGGWGEVEYLLWWSKERYVPVLATTSPTGTAETLAGHIGLPTTSVLFGDDLIGGDPGSGFRVNGGTWLNSEKSVGVGGRFFYVTNEEDYSITSSAGGEPILARPFFNTTTASADALLVAFPAISHGSININAENEARGFDVYFRKLLLSGYCNRLDVIGGFQNTSVTDSVDVFNSLISDDATRIPLGAQIDTRDLFEVENEFNGGFVGLMGSAEDGRLSWNFLAKVAFGNMNQEATISGTTTSSVPGAGSATNDVGLLALPTNIGTFDQDEFAIVPELAVSVGYDFTDNFSLTLGYSFIYWSEVALAGDMIDTTLNTSQLTGPLVGDARPAASLSSDGFFYTGLTVGGALRF